MHQKKEIAPEPFWKAVRSKVKRSIRWFFGFKPVPIPKALPNLSVTVIIPAHNEEASIAKTIESIVGQTYPITSIIVVDDCSTDRTNEIASGYAARYLNVTVIRTHSNQGSKAMAQNYVLPQVQTDLFATIDGDTILALDAIEKAMPGFHNRKTAIVCGSVIPQRIESFWERARFIEYLHTFSIMKPAQDHWSVLVVASGCFSIFRTYEARDVLGGFKHRTLVEDMDLTLEAQEAGYTVAFAPRAMSYPMDPPTFGIMFNQLERWYRGFFQCVMVRGNPIEMFRKSKKMAITVYFYMIWTFVSALVMPGFAWYLTQNIFASLLIVVLSSLVFVGIPVFIKAFRIGMLKEAIISFPAFLPLTYINLGIYIYAAWKEVVLRQKLTEWKKGHAE